VSQIAKKRPKGGYEQLRTPGTEFVSLAPNEARYIRSTKLRKVDGNPFESRREELVDEGHIVDYGCLCQAAFF
jgi:hypothetical protein